MDRRAPLTVVILTKDEELHIERCLASVCTFAAQVLVVDSYSTDSTLEIARRFTKHIYQRQWDTYATQFNWALTTLEISQRWVMRLDADEYVRPELAEELCRVLPCLSDDISGVYIKRRVYFMDRWICHGGYYPIWLLRVWRHGRGVIEDRWMDEHLVLSHGSTIRLENDIEERNRQNLSWWVNKHNSYATREVKDLLRSNHGEQRQKSIGESLFGSQETRKRWLKSTFYVNSPLFLRAFLYFCYRYFLRGGFLDGKEGLIFHFLQACWYRFLVDAKLYEERLRREARTEFQTPSGVNSDVNMVVAEQKKSV